MVGGSEGGREWGERGRKWMKGKEGNRGWEGEKIGDREGVIGVREGRRYVEVRRGVGGKKWRGEVGGGRERVGNEEGTVGWETGKYEVNIIIVNTYIHMYIRGIGSNLEVVRPWAWS